MARRDQGRLGCGTVLLLALLAYWACRAWIAEGKLASSQGIQRQR